MPGRTTVRLLVPFAVVLATTCGQQQAPAQPPEQFMALGESALEWTRLFVELGPRPAGSTTSAMQADLIEKKLSELSCEVESDRFVSPTPFGALRMRNIIARFGRPSSTERATVISGHYDTLRQPGFVGANDGGSSAGLLMALAERIDRTGSRPVWLVFFDGEEAVREWRDGDHTYGSRRLAARWAADGTTERVRYLINVDMIGDANLDLVYEGNSDAELRETVWAIATGLGYSAEFTRRLGYIEDDHIPFMKAGVRSLNLIDFNYGPGNGYWHTSADTIDKLDARSFAVVLHVLDRLITQVLGD